MLLLLCLMLSGCSGSPAADRPESERSSEKEKPSSPSDTVLPETDLTKMNANMIYAYLDSVFLAPEEYVGNRFRISGIYDESTWGEPETTFHYLLVADAMACCQLGLEFVLTDLNAPYPRSGDQIEICGMLTLYEEEYVEFLRIEADELKIIASEPID